MTIILIGSHVNRVCGNGHWRRKISLLPTGGGFSGEGYGSEQGTCAAPQVADVNARVGRALVKANAANRAAGV